MEETVEQPKKTRGWPKGKARGPRTVASPAFAAAPEPPRGPRPGLGEAQRRESAIEAPIHVRIRLKNYPEPIEFGCAEHTVENGFHVFMYPSERDRYRTTRREFAISEIIEIEITEARRQAYEFTVERPSQPTAPVPVSRGPIIHSARKTPVSTLERLATSDGPIKMDTPPGLTFGDHAG